MHVGKSTRSSISGCSRTFASERGGRENLRSVLTAQFSDAGPSGIKFPIRNRPGLGRRYAIDAARIITDLVWQPRSHSKETSEKP